MFWTWILVAIGLALMLLLALAFVTRRVDYHQLEDLVYDLDWEEAKLRHAESKKLASRKYMRHHPLPMTGKEYNYHLEMAILTKDRIHELEGLPNGLVVRKRWRRELKREIKEMAVPIA